MCKGIYDFTHAQSSTSAYSTLSGQVATIPSRVKFMKWVAVRLQNSWKRSLVFLFGEITNE